MLSVDVCLSSLVFSLTDYGLLGAETCRRNIINDKCLFVTYCEICWIKFYIYLSSG